MGALRIGVLGGTFDPIHHVHLLMAREAQRQLALDRVLFSPVGVPSHRDPTSLSDDGDRCAMTQLALQDEPSFCLTTADVERSKPTYTVDTVRDLRIRFGPSPEFHVIVGADNLADLPEWEESEELVRMAKIVGTARLGHRLSDPGLPPGRLTMVEIPKLPISSTLIRALVRDGRPIAHLTPRPVAAYIEQRGLYSSP